MTSGLRIGKASDILPQASLAAQQQARAGGKTAAAIAERDRSRISTAMGRILDERLRHFDNGHTFEKDLVQDEKFLPRKGRDFLNRAIEDVQFNAYRRDIAIRHAAQAAALLLAFIEVQLEREAQEAAEQGEP
jgi:hypothetical protein